MEKDDIRVLFLDRVQMQIIEHFLNINEENVLYSKEFKEELEELRKIFKINKRD